MNTTMNTIHVYTKAEDVAEAYDAAAAFDNYPSDGCYALAVATARELGGLETYNSNEGKSSGISLEPTRIFEFDDKSKVQVTYGGVYLLNDAA